jgi:hypothetical protein
VVHLELKRKGYNPECFHDGVCRRCRWIGWGQNSFIIEDGAIFFVHPGILFSPDAGFTGTGGFLGGVLGVTWVVRKNHIRG